jgi:hypothetical protein
MAPVGRLSAGRLRLCQAFMRLAKPRRVGSPYSIAARGRGRPVGVVHPSEGLKCANNGSGSGSGGRSRLMVR